MSDVWVADAGALIALAKIDLLGLLGHMTAEVLIPSPVVREIRSGPADDPARRALLAGFGTVVSVTYIPVAVKTFGLLGPGERAALALARKRGCTILVDDKKGRQAADALGIPKIGVLGVLIRAHKDGLIRAIVPELHRLLAVGYYLDEGRLREAAALFSETWP